VLKLSQGTEPFSTHYEFISQRGGVFVARRYTRRASSRPPEKAAKYRITMGPQRRPCGLPGGGAQKRPKRGLSGFKAAQIPNATLAITANMGNP
jgi:hypothetical protein